MLKLRSSVGICVSVVLLCLSAVGSAVGQTNPPLNIFGGVLGNYSPDTNVTVFTAERMELRLGAILDNASGSSVASLLGASYYFGNFGLCGEVITGTGSGGLVQSAHAGLELRKPVGNFCFSIGILGGRSWENNLWEGVAETRLSYIPVAVSSRMAMFVGTRLTIDTLSAKQNKAPKFALESGITFPF